MALSIKNPYAQQLANKIAKETGETLTQAVIHALEDRLERLRRRKTASATLQAILEISQRCSALPDRDDRSPEAILDYNEVGTFR